jgi:glycosyltransferase involved in cell wall biosynthesis
LVLVGSGPDEAAMRARIAELGLEDKVVFTGFLQEEQIALAMDRALALLLVSGEEQWGLVVNEAVAVGIPVIASTTVGATDALVCNLVNGFLIQPEDPATLVEAMVQMGADEARWHAMAQASRDLAWRGDTARFADAVQMMLQPGAEPATSRHLAYQAQILG